jgi:NADPH2:quinone reductase
MRAIQVKEFGGPEVLVAIEMTDPIAGPGQVEVNVTFVPVLFLDTQIRGGRARNWFAVTPPYVPGTGIAGKVAAVGQGVDGDWIGRAVVTGIEGGAYVEQAVTEADDLIAVPAGLGMAQAAALLHDGRTAMGLVEIMGMRSEEWVLVLGAGGGLGVLLVQLALGAGARVIAAAGSRQKLELSHELGADAVIDYSESGWPERVLAVTGGDGPGVVFDGVGGEIGQAAFEITARNGRFSAHGAPSGGFAAIDRQDAEQRQITVTGIEQVQFARKDAKRLTERALSEAAAGRIRPIIGQTFPLEQSAIAHRAIEARTVIGKTLLEI